MGAVWILARATVAEAVARNIFGVQAFVLLAYGLLYGFTGSIPEDEERLKMFMDGSVTLGVLFTLFFSFAITMPQLQADRNHGRLGVLLSSYTSPAQYVMGKYFGCSIAVILNLMPVALMQWAFVFLESASVPSWLFTAFFVQCLEAIFLVAVLWFVSLSMSPFMAVMMGIFVFVLGHFTYYMRYYTHLLDSSSATGLIEQVWLFLPNFEVYSIKNAYLAGKSVPDFYVPVLLVYTLGWVLVLQLASVLIFERQEH